MNWLIVMSLSACLHHTWFDKPIPYQSLIINRSCHAQVSPRIVAAIISTESGFHSRAVRYEPRVHDYSVGLMQIRVATAKSIGFKGTLKKLRQPWVNLYYGIHYLKDCLLRYPYKWDGIVAYNQGSPRWKRHKGYILPDGRPQKYATIVHKNLIKLLN